MCRFILVVSCTHAKIRRFIIKVHGATIFKIVNFGAKESNKIFLYNHTKYLKLYYIGDYFQLSFIRIN